MPDGYIMAKTVERGYGGQSEGEKQLCWNRVIIRKGLKELKSGETRRDNYSGRGGQKAECLKLWDQIYKSFRMHIVLCK